MIGWIVLAFTCARFAAMGFNRIVDREIDAATREHAAARAARAACFA
jgi:4-hydroxybenzoate polyprenyltransferase